MKPTSAGASQKDKVGECRYLRIPNPAPILTSGDWLLITMGGRLALNLDIPMDRFYTLPCYLAGIARRVAILSGILAGTIFLGAPASAQVFRDLGQQFELSSEVRIPGAGASVRFSFNAQVSGWGYVLTVQSDGLAICRGKLTTGFVTVLHRVAFASSTVLSKPTKIALKRWKGSMAVLMDGALVMQLEDNTYNGGSAFLVVSGGAASTPLKAQPVESMYFSDDFMRQPDEKGEWDYLAGKWQIQIPSSVKDQSFDKVSKWGANPFSLEGEANPLALATAGYSFWSDYRLEVAAKGSAETAIGMCADLTDARNYYLLRWTTGADGALMLLRVVDGKATVLGKRPGGFIPDLWYALSLRTSGGLLVVEIDHREVLKAEDTTFGEGKIGLYAEGPAEKLVRFDSVLVRPANVFYDSFTGTHPASSPRWDVQGEAAIGGDPSWNNYSVTSDIVGTGRPSALFIHYFDANNCYLFTWDANLSRLFAVTGGRYRLLSTSPQGVPNGKSATVEVTYTDGYLWAAIDGRRVVEGLEFEHPNGRAGFQPAMDAGSGFRNISVAVVDAPEATDALTSEFTNTEHHKEMQGWSGPIRGWDAATFEGDSGYWHKMDLFGDTTVRVPLSQTMMQKGSYEVLMNADGKSANSGYALCLSPGGKGLFLTLKRLGVTVATGTLHVPDGDTPILEMYRQGPFICASVAGFLAIGYHDTDPLDSYALSQPVRFAAARTGHTRVGIIVHSGDNPDMGQVVVNNRHVYAETFHLAPINWRPESGIWDVTSRWSCTPGWTWYGGKDKAYAVNWYKAPLWGDQCIDAYGGIMMHALPDSPGSTNGEAWRDLNCMFCGDGVNLFSGYAFVLDGWNGAHSRLLRKGHVVAESDDFQFPVHSVAHRLWFDTRIHKEGGHIRIVLSYYGENAELHTSPLIDWTDPDPLPGGFAGFWTHDNGIMLARAVLSSQQEGQRPIYTLNKVWTAKPDDNAPYPGSPDAGDAANPATSSFGFSSATEKTPITSDDVASELGIGGEGSSMSWPKPGVVFSPATAGIFIPGE